MANVSDYLAGMRRTVKNCPDITLKYFVREAVREFCRESWYYQKSLYLDLLDGEQAYPLEFSDEDQVIHVDSVQYNDVPVYPIRPQDLYATRGGDQPQAFYFEPPNVLVLAPIPRGVDKDTCLVRIILQPKENSDVVPEAVHRQFKEVIEAGALASILMIPEETWSNPTLGAIMDAKFRKGISDANRLRKFGHSPRNMRALPRSFLRS